MNRMAKTNNKTSNSTDAADAEGKTNRSKTTILFPIRLDRSGNPQATIHRTIATSKDPVLQNSFQFISFAANPSTFLQSIPSMQSSKSSRTAHKSSKLTLYSTSENRFFDAFIITCKSIGTVAQWDAIHLGPNPALLPLALFAKACGKKIITTVHEAPSHTLHRDAFTQFCLRSLASLATVRVSVSKFVQKEVTSSWNLNSIVVHNGVDTEFFNPAKKDVAQTEKLLGVTLGKRKLVLFVGALISGKGVLDVLENCKSRTDVVCVFIGDGPLKQTIAECAKTAAHIVQKDFLAPAQLATVYASSDVLFFPSRIDSFGMVYIEAMASGTPVLSVSAAAAPEIVSQTAGVGILCDPIEPLFSSGLAQIFKTKYSREKIAAYVRATFSNEKMAAGYAVIYAQLFGRSVTPHASSTSLTSSPLLVSSLTPQISRSDVISSEKKRGRK